MSAASTNYSKQYEFNRSIGMHLKTMHEYLFVCVRGENNHMEIEHFSSNLAITTCKTRNYTK